MKRRILKYHLGNLPRSVSLLVPAGSTFRSTGVQDASLVAWGEIPADEMLMETVPFHILFTGDALPEDVSTFLGTETIDGFVFHVYEGKR